MGGFAGGDEGGYWDIDDTLQSSTNKQNNIQSNNTNRAKYFIERCDSGYSIKIPLSHSNPAEELYDTISFVPCVCKTFTVEGCNDAPLESTTIFKAFCALIDFTGDSDITDFFYAHKVVVRKYICLSDDLDRSASYPAAFIFLAKEVCNLVLSSDELAKIASSIGE